MPRALAWEARGRIERDVNSPTSRLGESGLVGVADSGIV